MKRKELSKGRFNPIVLIYNRTRAIPINQNYLIPANNCYESIVYIKLIDEINP